MRPVTGMGANANDMMSLLDDTLFPTFDGIPVNLDVSDAMSQPYGSAALAAASAATTAEQQQVFSPDDMTPSMGGAGPMPVPGLGSAAEQQQVFSPEDMTPTMAGAGPLPVAGHHGVSSTLTEFTKRRNWPARVVEEMQDWLHILDANGKIKHVSPGVERVTGFSGPEIINKFLQDFLHPDDVGIFNSEFNDAIASGAPLRIFYRFKKKDGSYIILETVGHAHIAAAKFAPNPNNQTPFCQAVFMMARPYPTKNAALVDSFLEHKMENERLKRRIAELKREEAEEAEDAQRNWHHSQEGKSDMTPSEGTARVGNATPYYQHGANLATSPDLSMPPPERPAQEKVALTRENLEDIVGVRPDSIRDKMARYEGVSTEDTIEMLTGIRYTDGERSRAVMAGNGSPNLIKGDAGIAIPMDRDPRIGDKKKKLKVAEEYVCTDCGTLESPEWRKGPSGPKTLCNACGLRWAKKEKKKNAGGGGAQDSHTPMEAKKEKHVNGKARSGAEAPG
ncbi:white-collar 2 [Podospora aff. communis PSN243]|uniref:White-collar 2 n=1 Tax=Podospora aff. communis PSN243 TaxID=3040156 RepID=A0AAV9H0J2_9PEZI|nr:white-collar 2 [Podospora aff. communis PSN243]